MATIQNKIDKEENEQLRSIPAQRLIEKLSLLKNRVESAKKRWFWELLQNASDYNDSVNVKLIVSDERVTFLHDGAPFSLRDALNLISPDSNKQADCIHNDNIGKFGTGLVSTHILSSVMNVKGLCIDDEKECYTFDLSLDRSCFMNKQELIEQITKSKENLKESMQKTISTKDFNTAFSYRLGLALPELPTLEASDIDLNYLYDVLPYTLCFMQKVKSVIIEDIRSTANTQTYKIWRNKQTENKITFTVDLDGEYLNKYFAYFSEGDVATVFQFEDKKILSFPHEISRIFCGLPLIGTENIGLPFLLNSLKFMPTTEREGVEIDPATNKENRALFESSVSLYGKMLNYIATNQLRNAFNVAHLSRKYNGTQSSNQQFQNLYMSRYKQHILTHSIVMSDDNKFVNFSTIKLPFKESKSDLTLYKNSEKLMKSYLPIECDYQPWFDATDFTIFTEQKYTYENLAKDIENKDNIYSLGQTSSEVIAWLFQCAEYFVDCDRFIFSKYKLLPNQEGKLCKSNDLYTDINLPIELKNIYDSLFLGKKQKIGDKLLDKKFNELNILSQKYDVEMLAKDIDNELSIQYSNNQGNTAAISTSLNKLYEWINTSDIVKEKLAAYFHWYYPKRATLIVDMLTDGQREQALVIAQSGKMEALAKLATTELTDEDLQMIVANIKKLPMALSLLVERVDDRTFADSDTGDCGEEIVYKDLLQKYPSTKGFKVVWASKDRNEPKYDFEIFEGEQIFCYCDAKTTTRGIANADSIPFFMRKSQWDFLQTLDDEIPYIVARVFMRDGGDIQYMRILRS